MIIEAPMTTRRLQRDRRIIDDVKLGYDPPATMRKVAEKSKSIK